MTFEVKGKQIKNEQIIFANATVSLNMKFSQTYVAFIFVKNRPVTFTPLISTEKVGELEYLVHCL